VVYANSLITILIPLDEVEPWTEIVKTLKTGAWSLVSISKEAHEKF